MPREQRQEILRRYYEQGWRFTLLEGREAAASG
jgi:hypothetical protein